MTYKNTEILKNNLLNCQYCKTIYFELMIQLWLTFIKKKKCCLIQILYTLHEEHFALIETFTMRRDAESVALL